MFENINENNKNNICLIKISLSEGYEWGQGWTPGSNPTGFNHRVKQLATELHESLLIPSYAHTCMKICNSYSLNLYCHPMEISGYCRVDNINSIVDSCKIVGLNITEVSFDPDKILEDEATVVLSYFTDKYSDIISYIDKLVNSLRKKSVYSIKESVRSHFLVYTKENHCGRSSNQPTWVALNRIVDDYFKSLNNSGDIL